MPPCIINEQFPSSIPYICNIGLLCWVLVIFSLRKKIQKKRAQVLNDVLVDVMRYTCQKKKKKRNKPFELFISIYFNYFYLKK